MFMSSPTEVVINSTARTGYMADGNLTGIDGNPVAM